MGNDTVTVGGKVYNFEQVRTMRLLQNLGGEQAVKAIALRIIGDDAKEGTSKTNPALKAFYLRLSAMAKGGLIAKGEKRGTYKIGKEGLKILSHLEREANPAKAKAQDKKKAAAESFTRKVRKGIQKRRQRNKAARKSRKKKKGRKK